MRRFTTFIFCILCACFSIQSVKAEESLLLQQMKEAKARTQIDVKLHEEHNTKGELTHLGVAIFNEDQQEVLNPYLWRGLERMLLELLLKENDEARMQWMNERDVRLFIESTSFGKQGFTTFSKAIPILKNVCSLKILEESDRYRFLVCGGPDSLTLRLSLPKERELIFGTDKKEEDTRQGERIKNFKGTLNVATLPEADVLIPTKTPGVLHSIGQALYIDSLRTDGYYQINEKKEVTPVYSSKYPKESVRNLLLGKIAKNELKVKVEHHQYGNQLVEWTTNWPTLFAALCNEEVIEPYAAVQYMADKKQLTGILILHNLSFGYNHMLLLSIPLEQLDSQKEATLEGLLYTNIPQHNILSLFEERVNKKNPNKSPQQQFNHSISHK